MHQGSEPEQEPIGALLARLVDDGRRLAKAELALFRTDLYRRISRARIGALLVLLGVIMGQAAAVTLLVTLSFALTPYIGPLGGSAVSVVLGIGLAALLIRAGMRRLIMVVEDVEDGSHADSKDPARALNQLFERMRQRSREARDQLKDTVDQTQARLHPQILIADLTDEIVDHAQSMAHAAIDALRRRPIRLIAITLGTVLVLFRGPLFRMIGRLGGAAGRPDIGYRKSEAGQPAKSRDEESI